MAERFDDEDQSGATVGRPALERLYSHIRDGDVDRVVVYRLDRLTRKLSDWALLAGILDQFSVGLTVLPGGIDLNAGSLARLQLNVLNVLATFAELECELIAERLRDARAIRRAHGKRAPGRVPF